MVADARNELPQKAVFHCWQKMGIIELQDKSLHQSHDNCLHNLQQSRRTAILSLLNICCNSWKVEEISRDYLDYNALDEYAKLGNVLILDIILDL